jgi:choline dehydrogenase
LKRPTTSSQIQEILTDFIVIGGGTAGCIVSARLAEYGFQTLLLSSGSNDTLNPLMKEKSLFNQLFAIPHFKHYLPANPSPNLNNQIMDIIVWNTLGGNSINAGGIQRLMTDDWNYFINATGDQSFHIKTMSKYYKMVENYTITDPSATLDIHGNNGSIKIIQVYDSIFNKIWKNIANELNETFTDDLAGTIDYGYSFEASSFTNGMRSWSCNAYLTSTLNKYSNFQVLTGATAIKFDIDKKTKKVKNVLFVSKDGLFTGIARKEYILSAGTFFSPHLLMLSGIGDPKILQENHITIKHELKQVGRNLIDNGVIIMKYETQNFSIGESRPVALINNQLHTTANNPNTFFILKMNNITKELYVIIFNASPKSTVGFISLHNSNPLTPPKIILDYLTDRKDLETFINAIKYVRKVMSTETMKKYAKLTEILPRLEETDLAAYVKNTLTPSNHFIGTCSMGRNAETSVVDNRFKVHGLNNLRVVDASVFPTNFSTKSGPFLTVHALAEKAAHILHQTYL